MKHYIIDAHNIIYKDKELTGLAEQHIDNARSSLVQIIIAFSRKYPSYKFTMVFDGTANLQTAPNPNIKIISSGSTQIADVIIKEMIARELKPKLCIVVSSDSEIYNYARIHSCKAIKSEEFINVIRNKPSAKSKTKSEKTVKEKPSSVSRKEVQEMLKLFKKPDK